MRRQLALLMAILATFAWASEGSASAASSFRWTPFVDNVLFTWTSVSCASSDYCAAVGNIQGQPYTTVYVNDGVNGGWAPMPVTIPPNATTAELDNVSCPAVGHCIAVGSYTVTDASGFSTEVLPLVEVLAGYEWTLGSADQWATIASYNNCCDSSQNDRFNAVSCVSATECLTLGRAVESVPHYVVQTVRLQTCLAGNCTLTLDMQPQLPSGFESELSLTKMSCVTANWCMAVGNAWVSPSEPQAVGFVYDGSTLTYTPLPSSPYSVLTGVSCTAVDECTAVGYTGGILGSPKAALTAQFDSSGWNLTSPAVPATATSSSLAGVSCVTAHWCMAGGSAPDATGGNSLIDRFHGNTWDVESILNPPGDRSEINDISCPTQTFCAAVGGATSNTFPQQGSMTITGTG